MATVAGPQRLMEELACMWGPNGSSGARVQSVVTHPCSSVGTAGRGGDGGVVTGSKGTLLGPWAGCRFGASAALRNKRGPFKLYPACFRGIMPSRPQSAEMWHFGIL